MSPLQQRSKCCKKPMRYGLGGWQCSSCGRFPYTYQEQIDLSRNRPAELDSLRYIALFDTAVIDWPKLRLLVADKIAELQNRFPHLSKSDCIEWIALVGASKSSARVVNTSGGGLRQAFLYRKHLPNGGFGKDYDIPIIRNTVTSESGVTKNGQSTKAQKISTLVRRRNEHTPESKDVSKHNRRRSNGISTKGTRGGSRGRNRSKKIRGKG